MKKIQDIWILGANWFELGQKDVNLKERWRDYENYYKIRKYNLFIPDKAP
jgi:hypothetical protein